MQMDLIKWATPTVLCCMCLFVTAQQRTASLSGKVTDEREELIVGALVTITANDGTQKSTVTNAQGLYVFAALPPGKYIVRVLAKGFAIAEASS